jgi:DNA-binding response OmpR family regulator
MTWSVTAGVHDFSFRLFAKKEGTVAYRILVVDDQEPIRELLGSFLQKQGYEVIVAADGVEAIRLAESARPHLVILDVRMPELGGVETCWRLKSERETRTIPIIIATAFGEVVVEALDAGADDFVTKPFHLVDVLGRVKALLKVRHLEDEVERSRAYIQELREEFPLLEIGDRNMLGVGATGTPMAP